MAKANPAAVTPGRTADVLNDGAQSRNIIDALDDIAKSSTPAEVEDCPLWLTDDRVLDPYGDYPPIRTWGKVGDSPVFEREGLISISAKQKQGKSFVAYALLSSIISGKPLDTFTPSEDRPRLVMIFDIEMDAPTLCQRTKYIYELLGDDKKKLAVVPLKEHRTEEYIDIIVEMVITYNPDIVMIDVAQKLIPDYNNSTDSHEMIEYLNRLAIGRLVIGLVHHNKSVENKDMKGHFGTQFGETAVANWAVSKSDKGGIFTLKLVNARNVDDSEVEPINIQRLADDAFIGAAEKLDELQRNEANSWRRDLSLIFADGEQLRHSELVKRIMERQGFEETAAKTKISNASKCNAIIKVEPDNRFSPYILTPIE